MKRTRPSKRRWKARCRLGREIPREAIVNHSLTHWFRFKPVDLYREFYFAEPKV